jgi:hypothetical protein
MPLGRSGKPSKPSSKTFVCRGALCALEWWASLVMICVPDLATGTWQRLFWCSMTKRAVVVDLVHDFGPSATNVDKVVEHVLPEGLTVECLGAGNTRSRPTTSAARRSCGDAFPGPGLPSGPGSPLCRRISRSRSTSLAHVTRAVL